ncbi:MAG TPA: hypothetical protein VN704_10690 [Verrucomicrobiae bacterium]|nr:hypothetical protein [Verrucomicrobiae bacterium]
MNSKKTVIKSPKLQGSIIENILQLLTIKELTIFELSFVIQEKISLPYRTLKKYLVHLIEYDLISYSGTTKSYSIEDGGYDLLDKIKIEQKLAMIDNEEFLITIEKDLINDTTKL